MRKLLFIFMLLGVMACNSSRKLSPNDEARFVPENLKTLDAEGIAKIFPDASMEEGSDFYAEGTDERLYTILYPGTVDELHITWQDKDRNKIHDIRYSNNGKWKSKSGIRIGDTYDDLVNLNGGAVSFYGFGWDYSGAVDWNNGKMENSDVRVFLSPQNEIPSEFYGDHMIEASREEIRELDLIVSSILINYGS